MNMLARGLGLLSRLVRGRGPLFQALEVEISSTCNLRCDTCPVKHHQRPHTELPTQVIEAMVVELAALGYSGAFSPHFYNEPLLDKRLPSILELVRSRLPRATINLFTNFTPMTGELYKTLLPLVDAFIVTVDQPVVERAVQRVRQELNAGDLEKLRTRSIKDTALSNRAGALDLGKDTLRRRQRCDFVQYMTVDASGDVHLCCNDYFGEACFGTIKERSLAEIWYSEEYVKARTLAASARHHLCRKCYWVAE